MSTGVKSWCLQQSNIAQCIYLHLHEHSVKSCCLQQSNISPLVISLGPTHPSTHDITACIIATCNTNISRSAWTLRGDHSPHNPKVHRHTLPTLLIFNACSHWHSQMMYLCLLRSLSFLSGRHSRLRIVADHMQSWTTNPTNACRRNNQLTH